MVEDTGMVIGPHAAPATSDIPMLPAQAAARSKDGALDRCHPIFG
jgi:hypothetical protein